MRWQWESCRISRVTPNVISALVWCGFARWEQGESLVAVNVGSDSARVNCTVYLSEDNGQTWSKKLQVNPLCGYTTVALTRCGTPMVDTIVNMYDTEATCSINVALVDPTKM